MPSLLMREKRIREKVYRKHKLENLKDLRQVLNPRFSVQVHMVYPLGS